MTSDTRTSKELSNEQLLEAFEVAVIQHARTFRQTLSIKREEALDAKEAARAAVLSSMRASHEPNALRTALETIRDRLRGDPADFETAIGDVQFAYHAANNALDGRASQPQAGCAQCSNVAPIAKLAVRDGLAVRAGLYAPGLPDGEHDVYPAASSQPPEADLLREIRASHEQLRYQSADRGGVYQKCQCRYCATPTKGPSL